MEFWLPQRNVLGQSASSVVVVLWIAGAAVRAQPAPSGLSPDQIEQFLLTASVVGSRPVGAGLAAAERLTLTDGLTTHDAVFQTVDEHTPGQLLAAGASDARFVDSYRYNIAAYALARLLGLGGMIPVTVERTWRGRRGALSWWIEAKWDERTRLKRKLEPPDRTAWNEQMHRVRSFAALIYDTGRGQENVLITEDWRLWMVDFTRAFRLLKRIRVPRDLVRIDRQLLARLQQLTEDQVVEHTRSELSRWEIEALMARRDLIVTHFRKLIAEKGAQAVLY